MDLIIVSLCLLGEKCRFDGGSSPSDQLIDLRLDYRLIGLCPEVEAGLTIPRRRCEIISGDGGDVLDGKAKVVSDDGYDFSLFYTNGAEIILNKAIEFKVKKAILKENSPSCGPNYIYDGTFEGQRRLGQGVTSALLIRNGIEVVSEEHLKDI